MKLRSLIEKLRGGPATAAGGSRRVPRVRRRYVVSVVNEDSMRRLWSIRLSGLKAVLAAAGVVAALVSLIVVIFLFTPAAYLLPGSLRPAERGDYTELALKVDSLQSITRVQNAYIANIAAIFADSVAPAAVPAMSEPMPLDSLLEASAAERDFVRRFEQEERFNLSVLSPIAAEGMLFEAPSPSADMVGAATAVYRGTVVGAVTGTDGLTTLTVQHPNDFISVYANLDNIYVEPGQKVAAGQRLGQTAAAPLLFELWHSGAKLDPQQYIAFN